MNATRPVVFSGMQPSSDSLHLGNYLGALVNWVALQDEYDPIYCVVDLHAITVQQDPVALHANVRRTAAQYLAAGVDPERSTLFVQSHVPAHAELAWVLSTLTGFGEASRMTQFKDKSAKQGAEATTVGLFTYPVLMAADILLYGTELVPVGDDQRQHLELTRDIAERFNARYGETFTLPEGVYPEVGARIMDLQQPSEKMGKTGSSAQGTVLMLDPPEVVRRKFKTAVTDSGRDVRRAPDKAGITNLIEIMSVAAAEPPEAIESRYDGQGYGRFKEDVAEAVIALLDPIQRRYRELRADERELRRLLALGASKAAEASAPTLEAMYERMGFVRR
jgi:tryptophanyl-tRNA synthetase